MATPSERMDALDVTAALAKSVATKTVVMLTMTGLSIRKRKNEFDVVTIAMFGIQAFRAAAGVTAFL
ncbi:hypothetical protein CCR75_009434 [Bremia lactucae]|uniref:Uncharacterized protein n=1 Tax=Bremia lactucae TaxID=4779 RepID=A0A976FG32_BRELC|nr:hypothetical protein CCR75_009434 [Bremia lactucae]